MTAKAPRRLFGTTRREVPLVGQGSWRSDESSTADAVAALRRGLDLGMTHIDTAEMYGDAELVIAEAIAGRRDEIFLVSKVLPSNASRRGTVTACERSLKRLKTDRLDCYLLHWRGAHPLAETLAAFTELRSSGKIRAWGVSNFDVDDLEEAASIAGAGLPACNQVLYHLGERTVEEREFAYCREHGVSIVGYTPFGRGDYEDQPGTAVLERVAKKYEATIRQVILAFLTRDPIVFTIPKASTIAHAAENAAAGDLLLESADIDAIDKAFPTRERRGGLPTL